MKVQSSFSLSWWMPWSQALEDPFCHPEHRFCGSSGERVFMHLPEEPILLYPCERNQGLESDGIRNANSG